MAKQVAYVGKGPVVRLDQGAAQWPSGAAAGQMAFVIVVSRTPRYADVRGIKRGSGWSSVRRGGVHDMSELGSLGGYTHMFWKKIGASDLTSGLEISYQSRYGSLDSSSQAQIFCFESVAYVGRRSSGRIYVGDSAGMAVAAAFNSFPSGDIANIVDNLSRGYFGYEGGKGNHFTGTGWDQSLAYTLELVPQPGPSAPTLVEPVDNSEVTTGADATFKWVHNGYGDPQTAFEVQSRQVGANTWLWVMPDGNLSTVEQVINTTDKTITVAGNLFNAGSAQEWRARTRTDIWSPWSSVSSWNFITPPTVVVTAPSGPIVDDLAPTVKWTTTPFGGREQTGYRVTVNGPGVAYDSGNRLGNQQQTSVGPLKNAVSGKTYTFIVTVTQTGGTSASASTSRKISWTPPNDPTITAAPSSTGIKLDIGSDADTILEVQASTGTGWRGVADGVIVPVTETVTLYDVLAPYNVDVTYRVRASKIISGITLPTGWVTSSVVRSLDKGAYLVFADDLSEWLKVTLQSDTDRKFVRGGATTYPLSGPALVDYGPTQYDSGTMTLRTDTATDATALYDVLTANVVLLMRWPPDDNIDIPPTRLAVEPTDLERQRLAQGPFAYRLWTLPWVEQPETNQGES